MMVAPQDESPGFAIEDPEQMLKFWRQCRASDPTKTGRVIGVVSVLS